jgi:uncharacterized OB-fold protein
MEEKGTILYGIDPLILRDHYEIDYRHSYAQDSPFFVGLSKGKLLGSRCTVCNYVFATPRAYCMQCGAATNWQELPLAGRIHTFTTCYYGGEAFLKETPFTLILVEFDGADTLFLSRLKNLRPDQVCIGLPVGAHFAKTPAFKVTDVWFEPLDSAGSR